MKAWTENDYPMQAHPQSDRAFTDFLRRRAAENIAAYERSHRPRIDWRRAISLLGLVAVCIAFWVLALIGLVTLLA